MPLDAGAFAETSGGLSPVDGRSRLRPIVVRLSAEGNVGAALKAARESLDLAVEDIAQATRVRAAHVASLEAFDFNALPARPFVVGYVRAYARALGLETEAVVARFRQEAPDVDDRLRAPSGLSGHGRRFGVLALAVVLLVVAVVGWNIMRHAAVAPRHVSRPAVRAAPARADLGPTVLGAPLPAPPEAAAPPTYETPGLAATPAVADPDPVGAPFIRAGAIYGAAAAGAHVILQARKPTSLVVRGDGGILFARQMAAGEAWRAPESAGLVADVGNPASMEVFVDGLSRGDLSQPRTPLDSLPAAPPPPPDRHPAVPSASPAPASPQPPRRG
jgi:cytoskeleton protein RodZ